MRKKEDIDLGFWAASHLVDILPTGTTRSRESKLDVIWMSIKCHSILVGDQRGKGSKHEVTSGAWVPNRVTGVP